MSVNEYITIPASDGFALAATIHEPEAATGKVIIISSATAVPRAFYSSIAAWLCSKGYTVVTYNYRGIGDSRPDSLKYFRARMRDWGLNDLQGVIDWIVKEVKPKKLYLIGHSAGGQQAGLIKNSEHIHAMATMSAQSGYWKLQKGNEKFKNIFQVNLLLPLLSTLFGYFPWSKLTSGEDLPKGVAIEWAGWCRHPLYMLGDDTLPLDRFKQFKAPVLAYSFEDDSWGSPKAVKAMMCAYPNVEYWHISPKEYGIGRLGHIGFFRDKAEPLWINLLDWLEKH